LNVKTKGREVNKAKPPIPCFGTGITVQDVMRAIPHCQDAYQLHPKPAIPVGSVLCLFSTCAGLYSGDNLIVGILLFAGVFITFEVQTN
jgi:hypothetical protein